MMNFHGTYGRALSRSVGVTFPQCSRIVHASGTKLMRATNFEIFKILSTTWHAPPHTSRTVHAPFRILFALSEACNCGDKMRASVNVAYVSEAVGVSRQCIVKSEDIGFTPGS